MKKKIIGYVLIVLICAGLLGIMASCQLIDNLLNKNKTVVAPAITNAYLLKTDVGYVDSKEYEYNQNSENAMPLLSGEKFLINIEYENPNGYTISYVKLNNKKIMASEFYTGSSKDKTIIEVTAGDGEEELEETYKINSIFYNTGSATKRVVFNDAYDMNFDVVINPEYNLTIKFQNSDERVSYQTPAQTSNKQKVEFGAELSNYSIVDADYEKIAGVPEKAGGWVFEGYYTEPYGQGIKVSSSDEYYFWGDVTLYAHYSRMYEYEIVDLLDELGEDSIEYNYNYNGEDNTKIFKKGVIITKDMKKGHPIYDLGNTLVDEVLTTNKETGEIIAKYNEYPIIGIANEAFQDINTMTSIKIGKFVREIGFAAFNNCNALEQVDFYDDSELTTIGDFAFQNTKSMGITSPFTIPEKVTYLGNFAFRYSGWRSTNNDGFNESILHIKKQYKFIGVGCFFNTKFKNVVFEPGVYFESQINREDGKQLEKDNGWQEAQKSKNQIGYNLFANCPNLEKVVLENETYDNGVEVEIIEKSLNIIPDNAFDSGNYSIKNLTGVQFSEGLEYIGSEAFNYQEGLTEIYMPNSLKEIDTDAFYNCINVVTLDLGDEDSQLEILHTRAFANMSNISRVMINSSKFSTYGNGPFLGCNKLKSIEFINIVDESKVPIGFNVNDNPDEVLPKHTYSDFLYGTFETGELDQGGTGEIDDTLPKTYSVPTRIFCQKGDVLEKFKDNIELGKQINGINQNEWRDSIFVYDINLVMRNYEYEEGKQTDIALQAIYEYSESETEYNQIVGYSMAFWSARSTEITIPSELWLNNDNCTITELGMYCLPTSVTKVKIPNTVTRIEHDAFNNCTKLEDVVFNDIDALEYIGENAFLGTKIESFTGGVNLRAIGKYAFWKCVNLRWVDLSASTIITNNKEGRTELKTQYKFEYEKTAIDTSDTSDEDAIDYNNALYYGAFQGCKSLTWIYLPPNINRLSRALFEGCANLRTVIIENDHISDYDSPVDEGEQCFYENNQPTTVFDSKALAHIGILEGPILDNEFIIYGRNLDATHKKIYSDCKYALLDPANPPYDRK